jgi:chromosome segregation ATPase
MVSISRCLKLKRNLLDRKDTTMNQPTREECEELKKELKEEVRQLREQITEPMKVTRIEVASEDVLKHLDKLDQKLDKIDQRQDEHAKALLSHLKGISALQNEMAGARADILKIRESQADFRDRLETTATKDGIKNMATKEDLTATATKDDIARLEGLMMQLLQQKPPES